MKNNVTVIKLGGSVVTYKGSSKRAIRVAVIRRIARDIIKAKIPRLIIVHGAGSYGHRIVHETGIDRRIAGLKGRINWSKAQLLQNKLNLKITSILLEEGIPAFACQPTTMVILKNGRINRIFTESIRAITAQGLVPILFGVPAYDTNRICTILSGDQLAPAVAHQLGGGKVIHLSDVDGIYDRDPKLSPEARRIQLVNRKNYRQVMAFAQPSVATDVTGGMRGKLKEMIYWARKGIESHLISGLIKGRIVELTDKNDVGTLIRW